MAFSQSSRTEDDRMRNRMEKEKENVVPAQDELSHVEESHGHTTDGDKLKASTKSPRF